MRMTLAEIERLADRAAFGERSEFVGQRLELLRMTRREEHLVTGLDPQAADRASDIATADDANFRLLCCGLRDCEAGHRSGQQRCGADIEKFATAMIECLGHD